MRYQELLVLLPCHSLEDFPLHHDGKDAESLLSAWTALWHPALIASAQGIPRWCRVDDPPEALANRLVTVPTVSEPELPAGFATRADNEGGILVRHKHLRDEMVAEALAHLDGGPTAMDEHLAADFLALGFCFLQVELLTRQMRYSSNLDEVHFESQTVAAATTAAQGDFQKAKELLAGCFDVLAEERDHYYPVDAYVVDLTLVAPTTIGPALDEELNSPVPINLLLSGDVLARIADQRPEVLDRLRQAVEAGRVGLVGGECDEQRLPLLAGETIVDGIRRGIKLFEDHLGRRPEVFGRRRFGLTPVLPQVLQKLGFQGVVHATLGGGRFPEGTQAKTSWQGFDGTTIDAVARAPLDATLAASFLNFAVKMGESMDMDHVAVTSLAHWPGRVSPWYDDLRRIASYVSVLGKFITLEELFRETDHPGQLDKFEADAYQSPYLKHAVEADRADPITGCVRYWRRYVESTALAALACMSRSAAAGADNGEAAELPSVEQVHRLADETSESDDAARQLDRQLEQALVQQTARLAAAIPRGDGADRSGYLVVNPMSFVRRIGVETPELDALPVVEKPIYAAGTSGGKTHVVVDVPPMGFAWVGASDRSGKSGSGKSGSATVPLVESGVLRNEFMQVRIDETTGALRSIHDYENRGNRISQQLAFRIGGQGGSEAQQYSVMAADSVLVTADSAARGEITAKGRLLDRKGRRLAGFQQVYRIWRGVRVLELEIEIDPDDQPVGNPWVSYYASRFAWGNEAADLFRTVNLARRGTTAKRIEAPNYVEIDDTATRTAILTGGLPFHRRVGLRMLDSLLIVHGETARRFRMGIGVDVTHPLQAALGLIAPPTLTAEKSPGPASADSSSLFHVDARNVLATHWAPTLQDGKPIGFVARLVETMGRAGRVNVSCFRPLKSAEQLDLSGNTLNACTVQEGKIRLELAAHEWVDIKAGW